MSEYIIVTVTDFVRDEGSVVVFDGMTEDGKSVRFAADHRCGQDIVDALAADDVVEATIESWQILGMFA